MPDHLQRYCLRKARDEAEACLTSLTLNFSTVYSQILAGLTHVKLIELHLVNGGEKITFDERGIFEGLDISKFTRERTFDCEGAKIVIYASPVRKKKMLKEIVEYCSEAIALSTKGAVS